jgi:hypothetical protein
MISYRQADLLDTLKGGGSIFFVFFTDPAGYHVAICYDPSLNDDMEMVVSQMSGSSELRSFNSILTNPHGFAPERDIPAGATASLSSIESKSTAFSLVNRVMSDLLKSKAIKKVEGHTSNYVGEKGRAFVVECYYS